jgi:hypothetical protein
MGGMLYYVRREGNCVQNFVRKPERKRRLGRPRHRWEDNITIDLKNKIEERAADRFD